MKDDTQHMHDTNWEAITRYLGNEMDAHEKTEFENWLQLPENKKEFDNILKIWQLSENKDAGLFATDSGWAKFKKRTALKKPAQTLNIKKVFGIVSRIAATLLVLVGTAYLATLFITKSNFETIKAGLSAAPTKVTLPDGTMVYLNKGAIVTYPKKFGTTTRDIDLTGEAFFEVTRNEKIPFVIKTPTAQIRVLGTSFNVFAGKNTDSVQVAVSTGIVELSPRNGNTKLLIQKGKTGVFTESTQKLQLSLSDINTTAWLTRKIVFNHADLGYVSKTLERLFGNKIELDNENLKSCRLNADFKDQELDKILKAIEVSLKIKVTKTTNGYLVTGIGCL